MTNIKGIENSAEALLETYCSQMGVDFEDFEKEL